ncbi:MAG TPA: hypothetical protein VFM98_22520 [Ramlibacter sp.]|uniref:hypothetical protein n=1 Tax=Ramlibacter sp. TaxID=1917967 RepID=UPI002D80E5BC|nr:hypothetical protein [Ramlibacter sp.]HET8748388.1 hypothetical protein [Ramlibacter sp.]
MHTALCAFDDRARAEQAVDSLVRSGFARHDVHIEHKDLHGERSAANDQWDGMEREIAVDRGVLSSFGHFFASLLGRDNPSGHVDTYAQHVERGSYVVVVDAEDEAQAERARTLLHGLQAGDLNVVHRAEQRPLRDIVGMRQEQAGMVERSREPYEGWTNTATSSNMESEHALASHRLSPTTGPDLRDPDIESAPGLRPVDKDKPRG